MTRELPTRSRVDAALARATGQLLEARDHASHWTGELSTSALSTATAAFALTLVDRAAERASPALGRSHEGLVLRGLEWLARNRNSDGGWGDTEISHSNVSTTTLAWAALSAVPAWRERFAEPIGGAERWLRRRCGDLEASTLSRELTAVYGEDRTFSVPILTMCALAGQLGETASAWRHVRPLPFELAALPAGLYRFLGLPVVSYALPALIAMGQARHHRLAARNPLVRWLRASVRSHTLGVLDRIQPSNGGFLEAVPLTSFVAMSLAGGDRADHIVCRRAVDFLVRSVRPDGSWPIDTNLATWVTTLSVNALATAGRLDEGLGTRGRESVLEWLLGQQFLHRHPYTNAPPGAWAWTDLPGGVPDADDTAGALLAIAHLGGTADPRVREAAGRGLGWLMNLQNRDGGVPTFCRGWGKLPFDRSGADLTAHALRAFDAWDLSGGGAPVAERGRLALARRRALRFLGRQQRSDGSWLPLWFGNQDAPGFENPTYGTSRVLLALSGTAGERGTDVGRLRIGGATWLLRCQNEDGGWGGIAGAASSVEETAIAVEALAATRACDPVDPASRALGGGLAWLVDAVESGRVRDAAPIGFYFANLWYYERLYPLCFTVAALGSALRSGTPRQTAGPST